jgi:capsule polysaccharide export protein KpsE/RkpR
MGERPTGISLLTPILEVSHRLVAVMLLVAVGTFFLRTLVVERRYEARAVLATVSAPRAPFGSGGLGALSQLAGNMTGTASPELVAEVLQSRRVLTEVGLSPIVPGARERVIDRALADSPRRRRLMDVERAMRGALTVSIDRKTGLLHVAARHSDTTLVRQLVTLDIEIGGKAFTHMIRTQASAQREGQEARVRTTLAQLREMEGQLMNFLRANRLIAPYSAAALEQQRLQRDIQVAQQAYTEAVTAREAAYARELEQTPAVVVVDPVPAELTPVSKYNVFYALAASLAAAFIYITVILLREGLAVLSRDESPRTDRFLAALRRIPLLGRLAPLAPRARI